LFSDNSIYQQTFHCDAAPQNNSPGGGGVRYSTPDTPQPEGTQRPNNVVKLVCRNMNSYLLGRCGGLGQLFSPFSG
jgi:hypothetical protein